jgi:hypothetical protein
MLLVAVLAWGAESRVAVELPATGTFTRNQVEAAFEQVKKDPNLANERKIRTLKWVDSEQKKKNRDLGWLKWIAGLFAWFAQGGRFLFWGVLAILVGLLLVFLWRIFQAITLPERSRQLEAPSFVRDLDIRPESLPADIGSAAHTLWDSGEHRSALALLYRGLLSRLVHVHRVPIRDSSTEGDCVALASRHLVAQDRKIYITSLVRVWQRAVYGGENIPSESIHALCDEFSRALDSPEGTAAAPDETSAGAPA